MLTIDDLEKFGAQTQEGLKRCFGKADFYLKLVKMMPDDPNFQRLYDCIAASDLKGAFEAAHGLKGALGNLSLTSLYEPVVEITELLRSGAEMDYGPLVDRIKTLHGELKHICEN